jgi:importin subunit alpha-1
LFSSGQPQPDFIQLLHALPVLVNFLHLKDDEVLTDACRALLNLTNDSDPQKLKIQAVIDAGGCVRLVELLSHRLDVVQMNVLRAVGNIAMGDEAQTQILIESVASLRCS